MPFESGPEPLEHRATTRLSWAAAVAAYFAYGLVVLLPIWTARAEPKWDGLDFNYPSFAFAAEALRDGRLPLWDPYTSCGQPFISDPAMLWYQPGAVLAMFLRSSPFEGYMLFWAGTWLWGGLGAFLLAAVLRATPLGSLVAAVAFAMGGFFVGHGQHLPYLVTGAWVPWVLALAHLAVARERFVLAVAAGAALGLSARGGYGGLVVFEVLALGLWLVLAFLLPGSGPAADRPAPFARRVRWVAVTLATSVAILVVIWAPGMWAFLVEAVEYTDRRQPLPDALALAGNPFPASAAITFWFPTLAVTHWEAFPTDLSMMDAYVGALGLPFAAAWVISERRRALWLVVFAALWFLTSLGEEGGLRVLLHHLVPPTRYMRHNAMLRVLFLLPIAVAAGCGVGRVASSRRALPRLAAIAALATFAGASWWVRHRLGLDPAARTLAAFLPNPMAHAALLAPGALVPGALWPAAVAAAAVALAFVPRLPRRALAFGLAALFAIDLAWHVHANAWASWTRPPVPAPRAVEARPKNADPLVPRLTDPKYLLTRLNVVEHRPAVEGFVALRNLSFRRLTEGPFLGVLAQHRYWLSPSAKAAPPEGEGVTALAALGPKDPIPVFVAEAEAEAPLRGAPVAPGTHGTVEVVAYEPERVVLEVAAPGEAMLASTERFAPSWRVRVDDAPEEVAVVNYFFRGVRVPPGTHRVEFRYEPRPFAPLLALSYTALAAILAVLVMTFGPAGWREGAALAGELRLAVRRARGARGGHETA